MNPQVELILEKSKDVFFCQDLIAFICGEHIGSGQYRDVFQYNLDPKLVVKIQRDTDSFNNIKEFELWCNVNYTAYEKYFAPCRWISSNGRIMLQDKTTPPTKRKPPPDLIPKCFFDIKESNFGYIGKNFVAHDYDFSLGNIDVNKKLTFKKWKDHTKK